MSTIQEQRVVVQELINQLKGYKGVISSTHPDYTQKVEEIHVALSILEGLEMGVQISFEESNAFMSQTTEGQNGYS